jgi:methionyl-tRNA formyltransferase
MDFKYKIAFLGNWGIGYKILKVILKKKEIYNLKFVISQKYDQKKKDRWHGLLEKFTKNKKIKFYDQEKIKNDDLLQLLKRKKIDLLISCAYPYLLNKKIIDFLNNNKGIINIHGSLLPKYRGVSPVIRALLNFEKYIGITLHYINEKMDAGDIIFQEKIKVKKNFDLNKLSEELKEKASEVFNKFTNLLINKEKIPRVIQNNNKATYAPRILTNELKINFNNYNKNILNFFKVFSNKKTYFVYKNRIFYITKYTSLNKKYKYPNYVLKRVGLNKIYISSKNNIFLIHFKNPSKIKININEELL